MGEHKPFHPNGFLLRLLAAAATRLSHFSSEREGGQRFARQLNNARREGEGESRSAERVVNQALLRVYSTRGGGWKNFSIFALATGGEDIFSRLSRYKYTRGRGVD